MFASVTLCPAVGITAARWRRPLTPALTADNCNWFWHTGRCVFCVLLAVKQAVTASVCLRENWEFVCLRYRVYQVSEFPLKYVRTRQWDNKVWRRINMCLLCIDIHVQMQAPCVRGILMCFPCALCILVCMYCYRYTAVAMPMLYNTRYSSRRRVAVMIAVVWFLSFAISCPLLFGLNNTGNSYIWSLLSCYSPLVGLGVVSSTRAVQSLCLFTPQCGTVEIHSCKIGGAGSLLMLWLLAGCAVATLCTVKMVVQLVSSTTSCVVVLQR